MAIFIKENYLILFVRKKMVIDRKEDVLKREILKVIRKNSAPISTQDISLELKKPWHSIQTRCLMLQIENKISGFRVGRINLWHGGRA
jgi:hypothetical protein